MHNIIKMTLMVLCFCVYCKCFVRDVDLERHTPPPAVGPSPGHP